MVEKGKVCNGEFFFLVKTNSDLPAQDQCALNTVFSGWSGSPSITGCNPQECPLSRAEIDPDRLAGAKRQFVGYFREKIVFNGVPESPAPTEQGE